MASVKQEVTDEEVGPSVNSALVEERIEARRRRIARRLDALKKAAVGGEMEPNSLTEPVELSKSQKQVEASNQQLNKLLCDGTELVSNVEVACDSREVSHRTEEHANRKLRLEKLEQESELATKKFEEITQNWKKSVEKEAPQDLQKLLNSQKHACDQMIDEKIKLINELQEELKQKDDQYVKDLRKQAEDADLVLERMDEQIKSLRKAYGEELDVIESAFFSERKDLLHQQKSNWQQQADLRRQKEVEYMKLREERVEDFENQLQELRVQDAEEYNMVKIKFETDVQILEQNLQQMKATYQLNQEKLEYNFQVLKKRDEENTITKSQQKRKITRLQDLLNNLKQKLKKQEQSYRDENQTLSDDLKRMSEQYKELQKKFRHFQATDRKKFSDIWKMNEEQIKELVSDVLSEDSIIFEQQLGSECPMPDLEFLKNVGPIKCAPKTKSAIESAEEILSVSDVNCSDQSLCEDGSQSEGDQGHFSATGKLSNRSIKRMLELLCDEAGFLVEAKLIKLLAPIEKDERSLMKLDAIFNAIGIESEDDIMLLAKYLLRPQPDFVLEDELNGNLGNVDPASFANLSLDETSTSVCQELITPNEVVRALRRFVEDNNEPFSKKVMSKFGSSKLRDSSMDEQHWKQLASVIDEKKERLWDALVEGFDKYSQVLGERASLIQETDGLRQQNSELRMLLHQYLSSKVNQELEIPPTRVLQQELLHR